MKTKKTLILRLVSTAVVLGIVGAVTLELLSTGGGQGRRYGNVWLRYSWHGHQFREPTVDHCIVSRLYPEDQQYDRANREWVYRFGDGEVFRIASDPNHLVWVDPGNGLQKTPAKLDVDFFKAIESTTDSSKGFEFKSAEEFLAHIRSIRGD